MRFQKTLLVVLVACVTPAMESADLAAVHEWGTFTSVAGGDGNAISWQPLSGPSDLPCFVHRLEQRNVKVAEYGTVRMETPVLYFYPLKPVTVSVFVDFPNGRITEWYPQATLVQPSSSRKGWIDWTDVHIGNVSAPLPKLDQASHYYAARDTDAWPLKSGSESEKLLFYRGIADFGVDLNAVVHDDHVSIRNNGAETIPEMILFENQAGKVRYRIIRSLREPVNIEFATLNGNLDKLRSELENELIEMGLYRKEAHAMLETWSDSWFEEGLRAFYILPRSKVDALLPISIHPAPKQLTRVFVGRMELLSPQMKQDISAALTTGDVIVLKKYGRFLTAFLIEMGDGKSNPPMCERAKQFLEDSYRNNFEESRKTACPK